MSTCDETTASSTAEIELCNTQVYYCISRACNTPGRSEQDECYGSRNCIWLCPVSVRYLLLYLGTSLLVALKLHLKNVCLFFSSRCVFVFSAYAYGSV